MKKILITLLLLPFLIVGVLYITRYKKNLDQITPYPFYISRDAYKSVKELDYIPILLVGDKMALRMKTFIPEIQELISKNLTKPVKIKTLAIDGENIHRTLAKIKQLKKMPLIILFMSNLDAEVESIFNSNQLSEINENIKLYNDDFLKSLMMIFPFTARFIYKPIKLTVLKENIVPDINIYPEEVFLKRKEVSFKLYESSLDELIQFTKKRNSIIIPITSPLNLKIPPKSACYGALNQDFFGDYLKFNKMYEQNKMRDALEIGKDLVLVAPNHSNILFRYAKALHSMNMMTNAQTFYENAYAYDCSKRFGHPVYNSILKKVSNKNRVKYFDFHQLVTDASMRDESFTEDIYPQDVYFEKLAKAIAMDIKSILRL